MHPLLRETAHRPWPLPDVPWIMQQTWHDLLFMHWPISASLIRPIVPSELELDTFDGEAWIAVVPFWMSGIRQRGFPAIPGLSRFPELNVRTYVRVQDKPGVYFFSLDAASSIAVWAARRFFKLPYFRARMQAESRGEIVYSSNRVGDDARFEGRFYPIGEVRRSGKNTLEHFLTERYCLYTVAEGRVYRGDVHHQPWPLQVAAVELKINTMAAAAQIELPDTPPLLHFAKRLDVLIFPLQRV
jgi:Uncharacterized conserved protein